MTTQINNQKYSIFHIFLILALFFLSDDTVTFGTNINQVFIYVKYIIYVFIVTFLFLFSFFNESNLVYSKKNIIQIMFFFLFFLLTMIVNSDFRNGYFLQLLTIVFAFFIVQSIRFNLFLLYFNRVLYLLSVISLLIFFITSINPSFLNLLPNTINYSGTTFKNIIVCTVMVDGNFIRNTSIFREPGVFVIYLFFGVVVEFFHNIEINKKHAVVFIISLLTTFSTTGIVLLLLLLFGLLIKTNKAKIYFSVLTVFVILILTMIYVPDLSSLFFSKLNSDSYEYISTLSRLSSVSVPFYIFLDNPIFGSGLSKFVDGYSYYSLKLFGIFIDPESSSTNTIINTFAIFGIFNGLLLTYSFWCISKYFSILNRVRFVIFAGIILMLSSQELRFSLFFNVLFLYGLVILNKNKLHIL